MPYGAKVASGDGEQSRRDVRSDGVNKPSELTQLEYLLAAAIVVEAETAKRSNAWGVGPCAGAAPFALGRAIVPKRLRGRSENTPRMRSRERSRGAYLLARLRSERRLSAKTCNWTPLG